MYAYLNAHSKASIILKTLSGRPKERVEQDVLLFLEVFVLHTCLVLLNALDSLDPLIVCEEPGIRG
jgi:hypothetical protein